jgi:hypothetical protein
MTSAALADCNGTTSASASKARTKRTVFMKLAPMAKEGVRLDIKDINTIGAPSTGRV